MKSKTLFINILYDTWKKQIGTFILSLVLLFLALPVKSLMVITEHSPLLTTPNKMKEFRYGVFPGLFQAGSPFESSCFIMTLLIAVLMGMVAGWTGFAYLQDKKTVDLYHSIPVKRKELYLIKVLICGIDFLGPVLINSAIVLVIASIRGLMTVSLVGNLASMSIGCFVFCLVFYSIAAVSMLLTGKVRYGVLGTLMFQSAPAIMCFLINGLYSVYFETFVAEEETGFFLLGTILSPWMGVASYISMEKNLTEVLLCALFSAGLALIAGWFLYKKRPLETAGQAVVFSIPATVVKIFLAVENGLLLGHFFRLITDESDFWYLAGLILGLVITYAVIQKIYSSDIKKIFGHPVHLITAAVIALAISAIFRFDLIGFDYTIPDQSRIKEIAILEDDNGCYAFHYNMGDDKAIDRMQMACDDELYSIASHIIEKGKEESRKRKTYDDYKTRLDVLVRVRLQNGSLRTRRLRVNADDVREDFRKLLNRRDFAGPLYLVTSNQDNTIKEISFSGIGGDKRLAKRKDPRFSELMDAVKKDMDQDLGDIMASELPVGILNFEYQQEKSHYSWSGAEDLSDQEILIYPSYRNTVACLEKWGYPCLSGPREKDMQDMQNISGHSGRLLYNDYDTPWLEDRKSGNDLKVYIKPDCRADYGNREYVNCILIKDRAD